MAMAEGYQPIYMHIAQRDSQGNVSFGLGIEVNSPGTDFGVVDLTRSRAIDLDGDSRLELMAALDPNLPSAPAMGRE